ncbi:DUF4101 domain-containing protein [Scytonema sp. UIC 10036]|uniref:ARC6/PARC6 family protein n=1 Tax=Scytonema sp. UIC 10036 TaxID=2304196 RepID=UPI0012DA08B9|nr:ARC6/PARC6 family protein [Scytonema sp. UIC 10036]MUG96830.1 DUF4101 domain-containing protein [Scytonema sp. UIC 10036]
MHDLPRQILGQIITKHGISVAEDPRYCEGLLRDYCGEYQREIAVLVDAVKQRVPADIMSSQNTMPREVLLSRLTRRLQDNLALTEEAAKWAVESWALALGVITAIECDSNKSQQYSTSSRTKAGVAVENTVRDIPVVPPTVISALNQPVPSSPIPPTTLPAKQDNWLRAVITGGLVGASIIIGFIITRFGSPSVTSSPNVTPTTTATSTSVPQSTALPRSTTPPSPVISNPPTTQTVQITREQAINLVKTWLLAKRIMYFPPYNRQIPAVIATGQQYLDTIDEINQLESKNGYWKYYSQSIDSIDNFSVNGDQAVIQVTVSEDLALYANGEKNLSKSGVKISTVRYNLQLVDGRWKISDRTPVKPK